jgi:hypothetical protein
MAEPNSPITSGNEITSSTTFNKAPNQELPPAFLLVCVEASTLISFAVEVSTFEAANSSKDSGSASKPARISFRSTKKAGWAPFDFSAFWIIKANIFTVSSSSSTRGFLEANE